MKSIILFLFILKILFKFVELGTITSEMLKKFIMTTDKGKIASMLNDYKLKLQKYQKINNDLKKFKEGFESGLIVSKDKYLKMIEINSKNEINNTNKRKLDEDEEDIVFDIKYENKTVINDMDLVINKYRDQYLNFNQTDNNDEMCYIRMNITINRNDTSLKAKRIAVNNAFNLRYNYNISIKNDTIKYHLNSFDPSDNKVYSRARSKTANNFTSMRMKQIKNPSKQLSSLSSPQNNTNSFEVYTTYTIKLSDPDEADQVAIISLLNNKFNSTYKNKLCNKCLDNYEFLNNLRNEVKLIKSDLKEFTNKTNHKQDIIVKFSDYINRINLIKIELYHLTPVIEIMKQVQCENFNKNNEKFQSSLRRANQLIEAIQNSIRKENLIINFIVIS